MKSVICFVLGAAAGFVVAHLVNKDPRGREVLAGVDARINAFTDEVTASYRAHDARLTDAS